ncbi:hypothetical protein ACWD6P_22035 [Streptomyces sp. NPDC002446]
MPEGWATLERLHRLVDELEYGGPVPFAPAPLAGAPDLDCAAAAVLMAGLPHIADDGHNFLRSETRKTLGLKVTEAKTARDRLRRIPEVARLEPPAWSSTTQPWPMPLRNCGTNPRWRNGWRRHGKRAGTPLTHQTGF